MISVELKIYVNILKTGYRYILECGYCSNSPSTLTLSPLPGLPLLNTRFSGGMVTCLVEITVTVCCLSQLHSRNVDKVTVPVVQLFTLTLSTTLVPFTNKRKYS